MGRRRSALACIVLVLASAAALVAQATHENFSATSYSTNDDQTNATLEDPPKTSTTETTALPPSEKANITTENQQEEQPDEYTFDPVEGRYKDGYFHDSSYGRSEESTETAAEGDLAHRYEAGYYAKQSNQPDNQPDEFTFDPVEGRYKNGYLPESSYAGAGHRSTTSTIDGVSLVSQDPSQYSQEDFAHRYETGYNTQPDAQPDEFTFDPKEGRYKDGYIPQSTYAGRHRSTTTTIDGVSLVPQQTDGSQGDLAHRYELGYYSSTGYSQQNSLYPQQGSASQFSTMPYPDTGAPFVAAGAGCRTAYWVHNTYMWPKFFTVESTVGDAFGERAAETYGPTTILQGLLRYGTDPYDELLRSGLTSLLNSYGRGAFGIPHIKVIALFIAALDSPEAAKAQALSFETENVESISAGAPCT